MNDVFGGDFAPILAAAFFVGIVVGLTGMGGGALMTPALIFLGVGHTASIVTADLTAAAVYKTGGAIVHAREGSPNLTLAKWLIVGSVPMALAGPVPRARGDRSRRHRRRPQVAIGFALLLAASTYALRLYINLRRIRAGGPHGDPNPRSAAPDAARRRARRAAGRHHQRRVGLGDHGRAADALPRAVRGEAGRHRPGAGGAAGAGGRDLQHRGQPRPRLGLTIPLIIGSVPGTILGSPLAPRVPQSFIRRGIVVVLTMSGVALLDKAGWAPLGVEETHPLLIGGIGIAMIVLVPLIWGLLRKEQGLPMFGAPFVAELEDPTFARTPEPTRDDVG